MSSEDRGMTEEGTGRSDVYVDTECTWSACIPYSESLKTFSGWYRSRYSRVL